MIQIDFSKESLFTYAPYIAGRVIREEIKDGLLTDKAIEEVIKQPDIYTKSDVIDALCDQIIKKINSRFDSDEIILRGCKKENETTERLTNHYQMLTLKSVEKHVSNRTKLINKLLAKKSSFSDRYFPMIRIAEMTTAIGILCLGYIALRK